MEKQKARSTELVEPIQFDKCTCESPAGDPVVYELPDNSRVEIVACVECGGAIEWDTKARERTTSKQLLDEAESEIESLENRVEMLESQLNDVQKEAEDGVNVWELLEYHPDYFRPSRTNINPRNLPSGEVYLSGESAHVYHLPHKKKKTVCSKKHYTSRKAELSLSITDPEMESLRPCRTCVREIQKFRRRRVMAVNLVRELRDELRIQETS